MNSSVLVSGFVVVGLGAMAVLFNPFGSSDGTSASPTSTYQASTSPKKVSAPSPVSVAADPEPFVWENKKETVASTDLLKSSTSQSGAKKVAKPEKSPRGLAGLASKDSTVSKDSTEKLQTVSKTSPSFSDQAISTVDEDLNSFFGKSKSVAKAPAKKSATKTSKAKSSLAKIKSEPVRVASKPVVDKTSASQPTPKVKTSFSEKDEMFSFSPRTEDSIGDAPMMAPAKSKGFDMPNIQPTKEAKTASKTESSSRDFSGSFDSVVDKPLVAAPVVKEFSIKNPLQTRLAVTFLVDGKKVSLKPGQHFEVRQSKDLQVKFSRGGSFGFSERSLSEGEYQFSVSRKDGWKLAQ